jgi:hypothetical protein
MRPAGVRALTIAALLFSAGIPARADVLADIVAAWSAAFGALADANTGMTVFPVLTMPLGGRPEGMGGAYSAYGGGAEGLDANPAGSALMRGGELFVSHRNGISESSIEGAAVAGVAGPFGLGAFAKVFLVPFTRYDASGLPAGTGYFTEAVAAGSLAIRLLDAPGGGGLAAGANLKAAVRVVPEAIAQGQSAFAFAMDIGMLARLPMPSFSSPGPANFGAGVVLRNVKVNAIPAGYPLPTMLSLGVSYAPVSPVTLDVDLNIPVSLEGGGVPVGNIDGAVGLEVRISGFASVLAGFRLKGDNPRLALGARLGLGPLDLVVNYALDLMGGVNPLENYSVAATVALGQ